MHAVCYLYEPFVYPRVYSCMNPIGTLAKATRLSAVAMRERASDVIEVRLAKQQDQLEVLRNQQVVPFTEQRWMDLNGKMLPLNNVKKI